MKTNLLLFTTSFIFIALLVGFRNPTADVTIRGKIIGEVPEIMEYSIPIDGTSYLGFRKVLEVDAANNFEIKLDIEKPSFVYFIIGQGLRKNIIIEPNESYELDFTIEGKKKTFSIIGKNKKGQELYNKLPRIGYIQGDARKYTEDSDAAIIQSKILQAKEKEIEGFQQLYANGEISKEFLKLVKTDIDCFYAAIQGTTALLKLYKWFRSPDGVFSPKIKDMWKQSFEGRIHEHTEMKRSLSFYALLDNYLKYQEFTSDDFDQEVLKEKQEKGLIHTHYIDNAQKLLSGSILEHYMSGYLYVSGLQKHYEKELIALFGQFKKNYPQSKYTRFVEPMISPIVSYHEVVGKDFSENMKFVEDYIEMNSLKEGLQSFQGKKVYIDVWATWCGPCKREFKHGEKLRAFLKSQDVEILYISIDDERRDKQWKEMIKFYNLEGKHIRTNEAFKADLIKIFDDNGSISIPWYILLDEQGNFIKTRASRPSQLPKLKEELAKR